MKPGKFEKGFAPISASSVLLFSLLISLIFFLLLATLVQQEVQVVGKMITKYFNKDRRKVKDQALLPMYKGQ